MTEMDNLQLPGEDVRLVSLSDRSPLKRRDEFPGSLQARQKKPRSNSACTHAERRQRLSEILRAALDLVSDLETSDSADETSSGGRFVRQIRQQRRLRTRHGHA
jgi:hypothetical protein